MLTTKLSSCTLVSAYWDISEEISGQCMWLCTLTCLREELITNLDGFPVTSSGYLFEIKIEVLHLLHY